MALKVQNNASSTVADSPLAQAATTLNVAAGEGANFPSTGNFRITIWNSTDYADPGRDSGMEIVECTSRSTDALTIIRGRESTSDVEHTNGEKVALLLTAGVFDDPTQGIYTTFVENSDFDAQSILAATSDDTPAAVTFVEDTIAGRKLGGNVTALTAGDVRGIISVEDGSTADQTGAEIKALYEVEASAFTDGKDTKLTGIEALADVTDSTNVAAAGAVMDSDFTAADEVMVGTGVGTHGQITLAASEFFAKKAAGAAMNVTAGEARTILAVEENSTADQTGAEIKALYEVEANAFTDGKDTKLTGIEALADVTDSTNVNSAGAVMETDYDANTVLAATSDNVPAPVTVAEQTLIGRITSGNIDDLSVTQVRTLINVENGANNTPAASTSTAGEVELATTAEVSAGTSTTRANTPDALAGSIFGTKNVIVKVISDTTTLSVADGMTHFTIPLELNGMNLVSVGGHVYTTSSSGTPTFQIYNINNSMDMLSTRITIDASEYDSVTAASAAVINTSNDHVNTGDVIRFDCDVAGTSTAGMEIRMGFRLP